MFAATEARWSTTDQADQSYQDGDRQKYRHHIAADAKARSGIENSKTAKTKP
jgi:hypothetical protein